MIKKIVSALLFILCAQVNAIVISIEGNSGSGKSTLLQLLSHEFQTQSVNEQWKQWHNKNIFYAFLDDRPRWAYTMSQDIICARMFALHELQNAASCAPFIFTERCAFTQLNVFSALFYDQGYFAPFEWDILKLYTKLQTKMHGYAIDGYIYLKTDPEMCFERIQHRKERDQYLSQVFLTQLNEYMEAWLNKKEFIDDLGKAPVLVIDGTLNFKDDPSVQQQVVEQVRNFIKTLM